MPDCRRHILASHRCPTHVLDGDRLELVMDYSQNPARPLSIASSGIVWAQFRDKDTALEVFYDILLGRVDPMTATKSKEMVESTEVPQLRVVKQLQIAKDQVACEVLQEPMATQFAWSHQV